MAVLHSGCMLSQFSVVWVNEVQLVLCSEKDLIVVCLVLLFVLKAFEAADNG